jgi:hypothetical protein
MALLGIQATFGMNRPRYGDSSRPFIPEDPKPECRYPELRAMWLRSHENNKKEIL